MELARKVREKIKSKYVNKKKEQRCYITGNSEKLEVHHMLPIGALVKQWEKTLTEKLTDAEKLKRIEEEIPELFDENNLVILCNFEHKLLHEIFGRTYAPNKVEKVRQWIEKRRLLFNEDSKNKTKK